MEGAPDPRRCVRESSGCARGRSRCQRSGDREGLVQDVIPAAALHTRSAPPSWDIPFQAPMAPRHRHTARAASGPLAPQRRPAVPEAASPDDPADVAYRAVHTPTAQEHHTDPTAPAEEGEAQTHRRCSGWPGEWGHARPRPCAVGRPAAGSRIPLPQPGRPAAYGVPLRSVQRWT